MRFKFADGWENYILENMDKFKNLTNIGYVSGADGTLITSLANLQKTAYTLRQKNPTSEYDVNQIFKTQLESFKYASGISNNYQVLANFLATKGIDLSRLLISDAPKPKPIRPEIQYIWNLNRDQLKYLLQVVFNYEDDLISETNFNGESLKTMTRDQIITEFKMMGISLGNLFIVIRLKEQLDSEVVDPRITAIINEWSPDYLS